MKNGPWLAAGVAVLAVLSAVDCAHFSGGDLDAAKEMGGTGRGTEGAGAGVVLNEVLPAPGKQFGEEWIELFNAGDLAADIGGWILDDIPDGGSKPFMIPNGTSIVAGGFLVFPNSTTKIALNNDGDTVRLLDEDGTVRDTFRFNSSEYDVSWGRMPDGTGGWRKIERPTPGAPNPAPKPATEEGRRLLLSQVYYHTYYRKGDEFAAVSNPTASAIDVSGWELADDDSSVIFPEGTTILPGGTVFVTGNSSDFLRDMGFWPDIRTSGPVEGPPVANSTGRWPSMPDDGGWMSLRDPTGETIDTFAWGCATLVGRAGWEGTAAGILESGRVARRARASSGAWLDTNSSADWPYSASTVVGRTDEAPGTFDADWVKSFVSPDCSFDTVAAEIDSARSSVVLAVYQFESLALAEKLVNASKRGVSVNVLLEGNPVGGITDQERWVARMLSESGADVLFLAPNRSSGEGDRYMFMHAKYCIIDGLDCILASENWKNSGMPPDPSFGNRGWGAVVRSRGLASYLGAVFDNDTNPVLRDLFPYSATDPVYGPPPPYFVGNGSVPSGSFAPRFAAAVFQGGIRVSPVLSPDTSSLSYGPLLAMIGSARETLCIEQMACDIEWNRGGNASSNAYLSAVVDAARRGVKVRVLLDGTYLDPSEPAQDNSGAIDFLQYMAVKEGLDIQARIARIPGALKLHNKGVVADGDNVLVSTINWVASSVFENREVGLVIEGEGPAGYFLDVFLRDWETTTANGTKEKGADRGIGIDAARTAAICLPAVLVASVLVLVLLRGTRRGRGGHF